MIGRFDAIASAAWLVILVGSLIMGWNVGKIAGEAHAFALAVSCPVAAR